jgi:hypothetical protein
MVSPELAHLDILAINLAKAFDSDSRLSWMDILEPGRLR